MNVVFRVIALVFALMASMPALTAPLVIATPAGKVTVTEALLARAPKRSVVATAHGASARYEGHDLAAVLEAAGVSPVEHLRGQQLGTLVSVLASDGYRVVFSLAELDPTLGNRQVLLVDRENGQPLTAEDGPWRIVVPADQRPARWVRNIVAIEVSTP